MIIGNTHRSTPTVDILPWDQFEDPTANIASPFAKGDSINITALQRYLPSNVTSYAGEELDLPVDTFSYDHFHMFEFKVRRCSRGRSHDWTECPYAHPGEKARRRDPRKFHYSGAACPEFRKGQCLKGDACEYAHGVFECWLHPARYRTQPCKDGTRCTRRVCFFAHALDQLRVLTQGSPNKHGFEFGSYDGSPGLIGFDPFMCVVSSPTSTLYTPPVSPTSESPPLSPAREMHASMRNLQIGKPRMSQPSWGFQMGPGLGSGFCSPRSPSTLRPAFLSLPTTPTPIPTRSGLGVFEEWDLSCEEEPVMERVESGKDLRTRIYAKLSRENSVDRVDPRGSGLDVGWVSELLE